MSDLRRLMHDVEAAIRLLRLRRKRLESALYLLAKDRPEGSAPEAGAGTVARVVKFRGDPARGPQFLAATESPLLRSVARVVLMRAEK